MTTITKRQKRWEVFPHMTKMGIRGIGPTLEDAFEEAALGMCSIITDPTLVDPELPFEIHCSAQDNGLLLVEWINSIITTMSERRMIFSHFKVIISDGNLHGKAWGEMVSRDRHQPAADVKSAILIELPISRDPDGLWVVQCVLEV